MHIAIIGAAALILFLLIGGLFISAVVLEQRTRRQMAAAAGAPADSVEAPAPESAPEEKPKAMAAGAGH